MKTILFPTDFSENAEHGLPFVLDFAGRIQAELIMLHVYPIPYDFAARQAESLAKMKKDTSKRLKGMVTQIKEHAIYKNIPCRRIAKEGNVVKSILSVAKEQKADLIVMVTKRASELGRLLMGNNTAEVIRLSDIPVLVVPEKAVFQQLDKIVYAIDYKEDDLNLVKEVAKIATQLQLSLQTIHICEQNTLQEQIMHRGFIELANEKLPGIFSSHQLLFAESFFSGMEKYLHANPGTLLILVHYRHTFLDALLNSSITEEMVYQLQTSLLVYNLPRKQGQSSYIS